MVEGAVKVSDMSKIENVSVLLGHSSVRITERHYKPWVKTLQKKLEDKVRKAWG